MGPSPAVLERLTGFRTHSAPLCPPCLRRCPVHGDWGSVDDLRAANLDAVAHGGAHSQLSPALCARSWWLRLMWRPPSRASVKCPTDCLHTSTHLVAATPRCESDSKPSKHVRIGGHASGRGILLLDGEPPILKHRYTDVTAGGKVLQQRRAVATDHLFVKHVGRIDL